MARQIKKTEAAETAAATEITVTKKAFGKETTMVIALESNGLPVIYTKDGELITGIPGHVFSKSSATAKEKTIARLQYRAYTLANDASKLELDAEGLRKESCELLERITAIENGESPADDLDAQEKKLIAKLEKIKAARLKQIGDAEAAKTETPSK